MTEQRPINSKTGEPRLSADEMVKVFDLLKGSNSVELKLIVPDTQYGAIRRLGFDPVEAEPRQVYFFDTPDLALNNAGLIVRARRCASGRGDTVVKRRPVEPEEIDVDLRRDAAFKIEVDVMPGGYVCSASSKGRCMSKEVLDACQGKIPLDSIFNRKQREYYDSHAPAGISMNDLVPLGPTFLLRLKKQPKDFDRPVTVELWLYPDGSRILEMSTKGVPTEAFQLGMQFKVFIRDCGIPIAEEAVTKTSSALKFHSKRREMEMAVSTEA